MLQYNISVPLQPQVTRIATNVKHTIARNKKITRIGAKCPQRLKYERGEGYQSALFVFLVQSDIIEV